MKKKILFVLLSAVCLVTGCRSNYPVAQQSGMEDRAYLVFVGPEETYKNGSELIQVDVDGTVFNAEVVKPKTANRKGIQYGVATGRRNVTIRFKGKVIYNKQLFLSSQETKIINLP